MKDRIKKIRKQLDLTQQKFGECLGVKRNTVAQWETGTNTLTDQVINNICKTFNVREEWLRDGTGEMFIEISRDEQIATFIGRIQMTDDDSFKRRYLSMLASLDDSEWKLLEKMMSYCNK